MKTLRIFFALSIFASLAATAATPKQLVFERYNATDTTAAGVTLNNVVMKRNADLMTVSMDMDLSSLSMKGDRAIVYVPVILNGNDSVVLNPISLYGRTRWIQYQRNGHIPFSDDNGLAYRFNKRPSSIDYTYSVPYEEWMNGATFELRRCDYGCCNSLISSESVPLANWHQVMYKPFLSYVRPVGKGEKRYNLEGQSFVDFPVNQVVIYPNYRNNAFELDSIKRTIDIARNNPDATIDTLWLKGFASPESPYTHNTNLAIGRTKALKEYINNMYNFDNVVILTDYEPEDWEGIREAVVTSALDHRDEILEIIDSDLEPDPKEWKIKSTYPQEYRYMLQNFYPPLRHTNYKVSYTVRSFSDPAEILQIMKTRPGNLSLDEFYLAASSLEPGSKEYDDVFQTAVRMFPGDPVANLNAANSSIAIGDYVRAASYLKMAGNSPQADYARSVLAALTGNYSEAASYLDKAEKAGINVPANELKQLREVIKYGNNE